MLDFSKTCDSCIHHEICYLEQYLHAFDKELENAQVDTLKNGRYWPLKKPKFATITPYCDRLTHSK